MPAPTLTFPHKTKILKPRGIDIFNAQQKFIAESKALEAKVLAEIKACERKSQPKTPIKSGKLNKAEKSKLQAELARQKKEEEEAAEEALWEKQLLEKNLKQRLAWCVEHDACTNCGEENSTHTANDCPEPKWEPEF